MKTQSPLLRGLFCGAAVCASLVVMAGAASAQTTAAGTAAVEEVIVTGSFIKRSEGFPSASPVDVIGKEELEVRAPTNLANFFQELPYNFGSSFSTGRALGGGERGLGTVNLRGLGNAATLVLMNGHRVTQVADSPDNIVDVNSLVPDIMVQRFEILKDGASALYGTDAVAGVVNVITRDNFSGLTAAIRANYYDYSEKGDRSYQVLAGTDIGGKGHIVAAFSFVDQDLIPSTFGAPVLNNDKTNLRYTIASGTLPIVTVPTRNAAGVLVAATRRTVDPECGHVLGTQPVTVPAGSIPIASTVAAATDCRYFFFDDNALQSELKRYSGFVRGAYDIADNIKFTGELGYTTFQTATTYSVGESVNAPFIVPGTNPGNTFRAVNAAGQPLFAQSSGIAAGFVRDGAPVFLPARDAAGRVILSATPTVATSGIPFYEDVALAGRPVNSQCNLPTNNAMASGQCAESRPSKSDDSVMSVSGYFSGTVLEHWDYNLGAAYSSYKISTNGTTGNALTRELNLALDGLGGSSCPIVGSTGVQPARGVGTCGYFNPFGNSVFATGANAYQANTQQIIDYVVPFLTDKYESNLLVVEGRVSGPLFKLPAGDLAVAAGYQFRRAKLIGDYDVQRNNNNTANLAAANDYNVSRNTHAYFGEVNVPVFSNDSWGYAEINGAIRYEKIGDNFDTTNPKVGVLYNTPGKKLILRGSYGKSFVAPSLFRLFGNVGAGVAINDCPVTLNPACTGAVNFRATAITSGNPNLKPQTSKADSVGLTFQVFEDLTVSLDRWHYTFKDLITSESANNLILADPTGALTGRVKRNAAGQIAAVFIQYTNASQVETSGVDYEVNWAREFNFGRVSVNMAGTYLSVYDVTPVASGPSVHAAGFTNNQGGVVGLPAPAPKWHTNLRGTWSNDDMSFTALLRYQSSMIFSQNTAVRIENYYPVDLTYAYNYKGNGGALPEATLSFGSSNIFAQKVPFVPFPGFQPFFASLGDLRGRSIWARVSTTF